MLSDSVVEKLIVIVISTLVIIIVALITILPLYFAGYGPEKEHIGNYEKTKCLITGYDGPVPETCYEQCNCICVSSGKGKCIQTCDRCAYNCYDGFVLVQFNSSDHETHNEKVQVANNVRASNQVLEKFEKYSLNSTHNCFYDYKNPSDVVFHVDFGRLHGTLAGIIIFSIIICCGCSILIVFCGITGLEFYLDNRPIKNSGKEISENRPVENELQIETPNKELNP